MLKNRSSCFIRRSYNLRKRLKKKKELPRSRLRRNYKKSWQSRRSRNSRRRRRRIRVRRRSDVICMLFCL